MKTKGKGRKTYLSAGKLVSHRGGVCIRCLGRYNEVEIRVHQYWLELSRLDFPQLRLCAKFLME